MERKFEVGDKVRITSYEGTKWHGLVGVISETCVDDDVWIVKFDEAPCGFRSGGFSVYDFVSAESRIDPTIITRLNEVITMLREQASMTSTLDKHAGIIARIDAVNVAIDELSKEER